MVAGASGSPSMASTRFGGRSVRTTSRPRCSTSDSADSPRGSIDRAQRLAEVVPRVHGLPVLAHLEVEVIAVATPRAARPRDHLPAVDRLALPRPQLRVVRVARAERLRVLNTYELAVAAEPSAHGDPTPVGRVDRCTHGHSDVDAGMARAPQPAEAQEHASLDGPDRLARAELAAAVVAQKRAQATILGGEGGDLAPHVGVRWTARPRPLGTLAATAPPLATRARPGRGPSEALGQAWLGRGG